VIRNNKQNILIVLAMIYLAQIAYFYPRLPEKVASHFNHLGEADGWMSKMEFTVFQVILLGFILATTSLIPAFFNKLPDSLINIPNKSYWLASERRKESILKLAGVTDNLRAALLLLFLSINYFTFQANITGGNLSNGTWLVLSVFLIYTIYWTIGLRKTFRI
jgi:uncharacterized membrane protein